MATKCKEYIYSLSKQRETRALLLHPHHLTTSVNITNNLDELTPIEELFKQSQWQSDYPIPINAPSVLADRDFRLDNRISLVYEKEKHEQILQKIQYKYQANKKKRNIKKTQKKSNQSLDLGYISQYAEIFSSNPDPYFSGSYNWYFTGTNMIVNEIDDYDQWLYHVTGPGLEKLELSKISYNKPTGIKLKNKTIKILSNELFKPIDSGGMIYELNQQNQQIYIRQKHQLTTIQQNQIITQYETPENVPLVSACTINGSKQQLITIDANRMLRINDLNNKNPTKSIEHNLLTDKEFNSDNWSCLRPFNIGHNTFTYTNRKTVRVFDSRQEISLVKPILAFEFGNLIDCCEEIISIEPSVKNLNVLYISTTHKLFTIDIRQLNLNNTNLLKLNHHLKCHPTTLCVLDKLKMGNDNNTGEIIVIGGSLAGDYRFCETELMSSSKNDSNYYSTYIPEKPNDIFKSYNQVKMNGHCLEPFTRVAQQIKLSITGMALCKPTSKSKSINPNQFYLLQQNSFGDIFVQNFTNKSDENQQTTKMICDSFIQWDNKLKMLEQKNESFYSTDLTTFSSMAACIAKNIINPNGIGGGLNGNFDPSGINVSLGTSNPKQHEEDEEEIRRLSRPKRWQQSLQCLQTYTDALAADMLNIWEIQTEPIQNLSKFEGNNTVGGNETITQEMNGTDKVFNWLSVTKSEISFDGNNLPQSTQKNTDAPQQEQSSMDLVNFTETMDMDTTMISTTLFENINKSIKKNKSRRSRVFNPGF